MPTSKDDSVAVPSTENATSNSKKLSKHFRSGDKSTSSSSSKDSTSQKRPEPSQKARQPAKVGCKPNVFTILGQTKPKTQTLSKGRGSSKSAMVQNQAGIWYHVHWEPVDKEAYKGSVSDKAELRDMLFNDNAQMQCKHCGHRRSFKPATHFKNHLLAGLSLTFSPTGVTAMWPSSGLAGTLHRYRQSIRHFFYA
jgi:DNA-directed RNA polymerase subunit RPC12/RpoP